MAEPTVMLNEQGDLGLWCTELNSQDQKTLNESEQQEKESDKHND